jgi:hypothetical protein
VHKLVRAADRVQEQLLIGYGIITPSDKYMPLAMPFYIARDSEDALHRWIQPVELLTHDVLILFESTVSMSRAN